MSKYTIESSNVGNAESSSYGYRYGMEHSAKNNSDYKVNASSDSYDNGGFSEESPRTKFGEWLNEFNDMQVSPQSNESSSKSSRSQIELSKSGVFVVEDNCEHYTPESNSPVHFTPRDCWLEDERPFRPYRSPASFISSPSPAFVFNSSPYTSGCSTSTPHNFQARAASPMQNVIRTKYVPSISPEVASEKCSLLRRIRLQTPRKIEPQTKTSEIYIPPHKRSSLNDIGSNRLSWRQNSSIRRTQRERLSWPRSNRDCKNSSKENVLSNSYYSSRSDSSWEYPMGENDEVEPVVNLYQLLGDSLMVRFAEQLLYKEVKMIQGTRTVGLCVSGQKIMDLYRKVSMKRYPITEKIVLLIGTNDILQNTDDEEMQHTLKKLLNELLGNYANRIVLLTIPPIPKLQDREDQWQRIERYNRFIRSLKDEHVTVADINGIYLENERSCKLDYFEKFYGDGLRKDMIHLNNRGLKEIYNFLTENKFLT